MARSTATTTKCLSVAQGLSSKDMEKLEAGAAKYNTTDINADFASAAADLLADLTSTRDALKKAIGAKFSKSGTAAGQTAAELTESLTEFMNTGSLGRNVIVVDTATDLDGVRNLTTALNNATAMAWASDGKAYLIADRIPKGQERAVFVHEVGVHLGLERMLSKENMAALTGKLKEWAAANDGSIESELSKKALARVDAAQTEAADRDSEHLAYFLEEAIKAGIDPAAKSSSPFVQWFRTLYAAFKNAARKLGMNPDKLNAQDLVNMAYGAARLEIAGKWHGTAAEFRKFNHAFISTGEGGGNLGSGLAYGYGTYMGEAEGTGRQYHKDDVGRKSGTRTEYNGKVYDTTQDKKGTSGWSALENDLKRDFPDVQDLYYVSEGLASGMSVAQLKKDVVGFASKKVQEELTGVLNKITQSGPEGSLMRLDHNVQDHEMLDWGLPINQQRKNVIAALEDVKQRLDNAAELENYQDNLGEDYENWTGADLVQRIIPRMLVDGLLPAEFDENLGTKLGEKKAVSKYLELLGIKGSKHLDQNSRNTQTHEYATDADMGYPAKGHFVISRDYKGKITHTGSYSTEEAARKAVADRNSREEAPTYNHVIFNDKNILRVATNPGADSSRIKFSKAVQATADKGLSDQAAAVDRVREMITPKIKDNWTNVTEYFKKAAPWLLSNYQLVEQYGKKFTGGSLSAYVGLQQTMTQERLTQSMEFNKVALRWDALKPNEKERLNKLMLRATLDGIHPDETFTPGQANTPNGHLTAADKPKYDSLKAQYDALGKGSEAQKIYGESRDLLRKQWDDRQDAYKELVDYVFSDRMRKAADRNDNAGVLALQKQADDALNEYKKERAKLKGPYFPLMRFGAYLAIGESPELTALKQKASEAVGEERTKLTKQLDAMRTDPKHYEVSAHESRGALNAAKRTMTARGLVAREDMQDQQLEGVKDGSAKIIAELGNMLDATFDPDIAGAVNDAMANVYLRSLPEMHALRREAHRKGIEGANADMLRAFASAGQSGSFYMSRMRHASAMTEAMFKMKQEAKGDINMQHIHREMEKRMALDMQFKETPVQDAVSSVSWVYHLGMSPSAMVINTTQPWMVTLPMLAGKYSLGSATKVMGKAHADAVRVLSAARMKDGKWDWWSGISENSLTDKEERTALRALMTKGIVDEGLQHELNVFADGKTRWLANFNRRVGWMNQQIELTNRTASALAAFRLARQSGMAYDAALKSAYDITLNSQFDYSQEGTARFMREGGGVPLAKLVFQFRKFQQGMLYALGANIKKLADPKERKEAAATLAYLSATSGLMAGAMGLPFFALAAGIANAFIDDDDPEGDFETRMRNWLVDITGDQKMASVLAKGIPAAVGVDISSRIGLGDIASAFPMERFDGATGKDQAGKLAVAALGPAAGLAARMYDGVNLMSEGDWGKGMEKLSPKVIADAFKAGRYASDGLTTGGGNATDANLDGWDAALRAVGMQPLAESNYYDKNRANNDVKSAMEDRRNAIATQFKKAYRSGDMGPVREKIQAFNETHPTQRITPKMETEWRKNAVTPPKADKKAPQVARF